MCFTELFIVYQFFITVNRDLNLSKLAKALFIFALITIVNIFSPKFLTTLSR